MKIEKVKIDKVFINENNPRFIRDAKFQKLVNSIKEFPKMLEIRPIVVNDDMVVLGGNMRLKACEEAGLKEVFIIKASELTPEEQNEFIIKDNVSFGEWDFDLLANNFDAPKLEEWGVEIPSFETKELEAKEDNFNPKVDKKCDIFLGDIIEINRVNGTGHRLLCGDSTDTLVIDKLMNGKKADITFTSPPYNADTSFANVKNKGKLYENYEDNLDSKDYVDFASAVLENCFINTDGFIFWNVNYNSNSKNEFIKQIFNRIDNLEETICWKKIALPNAYGLTRVWEPIFVFKTDINSKKRIGHTYETEFNFWDINNSKSLTESHRASFPIALPEKAIKLTDAKLIFEPFCGSGTTMASAHQLNADCYGIELDPNYCQNIIDRMLKLDSTLQVKINGIKYIPQVD